MSPGDFIKLREFPETDSDHGAGGSDACPDPPYVQCYPLALVVIRGPYRCSCRFKPILQKNAL